jgi:hypothetical protein
VHDKPRREPPSGRQVRRKRHQEFCRFVIVMKTHIADILTVRIVRLTHFCDAVLYEQASESASSLSGIR